LLPSPLPIAQGGTGSAGSISIPLNGQLVGSILLTKVAGVVTITATSSITHDSLATPVSNDGLVPLAYRPLSTVACVPTILNALNYTAEVAILSSGRITVTYGDRATGAAVARTSGPAFTISYLN